MTQQEIERELLTIQQQKRNLPRGSKFSDVFKDRLEKLRNELGNVENREELENLINQLMKEEVKGEEVQTFDKAREREFKGMKKATEEEMKG